MRLKLLLILFFIANLNSHAFVFQNRSYLGEDNKGNDVLISFKPVTGREGSYYSLVTYLNDFNLAKIYIVDPLDEGGSRYGMKSLSLNSSLLYKMKNHYPSRILTINTSGDDIGFSMTSDLDYLIKKRGRYPIQFKNETADYEWGSFLSGTYKNGNKEFILSSLDEITREAPFVLNNGEAGSFFLLELIPGAFILRKGIDRSMQRRNYYADGQILIFLKSNSCGFICKKNKILVLKKYSDQSSVYKQIAD